VAGVMPADQTRCSINARFAESRWMERAAAALRDADDPGFVAACGASIRAAARHGRGWRTAAAGVAAHRVPPVLVLMVSAAIARSGCRAGDAADRVAG
jgi:hypothetical protein